MKMIVDRLGLLSFLTAVIASTACVYAEESARELARIKGLPGQLSGVDIAVPAAEEVALLKASSAPKDIDLKRMAAWAMNYLIESPRKELGYEPVFQCRPLQCPPIPKGHDPVVPCDTDARMDWEWYYMREISGSDRGKDVEEAFHNRMRGYINADGRVLSPPGCYHEEDTDAVYRKEDYVIHIWGSAKILQSLALDYARSRNPESKTLARKVLLALKQLATWDNQGRCYFRCGMGAFKTDGAVVPNRWNAEPAPLVEPLITYWRVFQDPEALAFAKAYADGIIDSCQPDGIRFQPDGSFVAHTHATMHALWGVAHLGLVSGESRYTDFAKRVWDWVLYHRGTGTGWFMAAMDWADNQDETCNTSDMMSLAALIAQSGHPEYFDFVERYLRNRISTAQFIVTPEFETYYRELNQSCGEDQIRAGLQVLRKFQGGIIGVCGLNDRENELLGKVNHYFLAGCCSPEGMRAIHTTWTNVIDRLPNSPLGPEGVYVNMSLRRDSMWGKVVSFMPDAGRLTVEVGVKDTFFLRPPSWAARNQVRAFVNAKSVPVEWSGDYIRFAAEAGNELTITYPLVAFTQKVSGLWPVTAPNLTVTYNWLGNMVTSSSPLGGRTPLFSDKPHVLPPAPGE